MGEVFTAHSKNVLLQEYPQGDLKFLRNHYAFLRTQKCKHFQIFIRLILNYSFAKAAIRSYLLYKVKLLGARYNAEERPVLAL